MSASTGPIYSQRKESDLQWYPILASTTINPGTLVSITSAGYAIPARSGTASDMFVGVAYDGGNNSAGASGAINTRVQKTGSFLFTTVGATQAWVGSAVYASDDNDLTQTSTNNQLVGYVCEFLSATQVRVRIDLAAK